MILPTKRGLAGALIAAATALAPAMPGAQESDDLTAQIEQLREAMRQTQAAYEQQIQALETRVRDLEANAAPSAPASGYEDLFDDPASGGAFGEALSFQSGSLSGGLGFNLDAAASGSSVPDRVLKSGESGLQAGGHDPNKNGFTLQAGELALFGAADPYFDGFANMLFLIDEAGETKVELEEAWAQTLGLPWGLQVKAGQFYTEFGRANERHVHQQDFADQPFIVTRMFGGDGQRAPGARLAWLSPLPWFSEFYFGAQNCVGETMPSFCGADEGRGEFANVIGKSRNFSDALVYSGRWLNGFDVSDTLSMNLGLSANYGPNRTGPDNHTLIYGADFYGKWLPARAVRGFPFVSLTAEVIGRHYEAGNVDNANLTDLDDWGLYTQGLHGFTPGWVAGLRFEYGNGSGQNPAGPRAGDDVNRAARYRISPNLTWYPTEFSHIRLQYNHDWSEHLPAAGLAATADPSTGTLDSHTADSIWVQLGIALGAHGAHKF